MAWAGGVEGSRNWPAASSTPHLCALHQFSGLKWRGRGRSVTLKRRQILEITPFLTFCAQEEGVGAEQVACR